MQSKSLISVEAKKSPIKDVLKYLNEIQYFIAYFHKYDWLCHLAAFIISLVQKGSQVTKHLLIFHELGKLSELKYRETTISYILTNGNFLIEFRKFSVTKILWTIIIMVAMYAKQKHPGCKKSAGPIRSVVIVDQNV